MKHYSILFLLVTFIFFGCGKPDDDQASAPAGNTGESGLTAFELEHGIGPVTERVTLDSDDVEKIEKGRQIFDSKCAACHQMNERFVGPALGDVTERRSTEFVLNMILNPSEMARQHPEGLKMLAEYMTPMPFQNVSMEEARAITAYLKQQANNTN
jgi:mono/diheme cytochrome c family protein